MKKSFRSKNPPAAQRDVPDITGIINTMQQQLALLDRKIDTLISRSSQRPFETKQFSMPSQRFGQPDRQPEAKQNNVYRERVLHKAICADCNKECEVPFRPSGGRPVYCKECFAIRKKGGINAAQKRDDAPVRQETVQKKKKKTTARRKRSR